MAPSGIPRRWAPTSAGCLPSCCSGCAPVRATRVCCTTGRANGIRASSCRAGRSTGSGDATASRSSAICRYWALKSTIIRVCLTWCRARCRRLSRPSPRPASSCWVSRPGWASIRSGPSRLMRIRCTSSIASSNCRSMSMCSMPGSTIRWSASVCIGFLRTAWASRSAGFCRSSPIRAPARASVTTSVTTSVTN